MTTKVPMRQTAIVDAHTVYVAVGSTGLLGGDAGHGGRTVIRLIGLEGFGIDVRQMGDEVKITVTGDAELRALARAVDYVASELLNVLAAPPGQRSEPDFWIATE